MSHIEEVKNYIVETFLFGDASPLENDTSLLSSGIVDSTGLIEIISFLEDTFNIKINDDELLPENLDSLNKIDAFLAEKLVS